MQESRGKDPRNDGVWCCDLVQDGVGSRAQGDDEVLRAWTVIYIQRWAVYLRMEMLGVSGCVCVNLCQLSDWLSVITEEGRKVTRCEWEWGGWFEHREVLCSKRVSERVQTLCGPVSCSVHIWSFPLSLRSTSETSRGVFFFLIWFEIVTSVTLQVI